ncbi:ervatamin-B-like [Vicia villosa]|uniref:ervatamin-B-like n=1 Tax=Vicia villosa TaxID=3911 RepID=UPI00273CF1B2|nr:ervatamin-B-like [Vicia villosa]
MKISYNSMPFRFFIILTACLCIYFAIRKKTIIENEDMLSIFSSFEIPASKYTSILGPKFDKLPNEDDVIQLFQVWKKEQGRVYNDLEEMANKFDTFVTNLKYIVETNAKRDSPHSSLLGLTSFVDLSFVEFKERYMTTNSDTINIVNNDDVGDLTCSDPPPSKDWRSEKAVTSVKNQGTCGSCASFSTVGAIEGIVAIVTKKLLDLSAQELVDCVGNGCHGIYTHEAFQWVLNHGGVALESKYPYTAVEGSCKASQIPNSASSKIDSFYHVDKSEKALLCAVAKQPISVCIYAATQEFQHYYNGILQGRDCPVDSTVMNHCMLIVGYASHEGQYYWIVKNSYGTKWGGMGGYMFIRRNTTKMYGVCAINAWAIYPNKNK